MCVATGYIQEVVSSRVNINKIFLFYSHHRKCFVFGELFIASMTTANPRRNLLFFISAIARREGDGNVDT